MKTSFFYRFTRGQTALEYLLLLAVVAVIVIASFSPGSLIQQVHDAAQGYYNTVTSVIMGANPNPINGGWCPVTCPSGAGPSVIYGACECPVPAFGGSFCPSGNVSCSAGKTCKGGQQVNCQGVSSCGPCPTGQVCNSSGVCGCANGLTCSTIKYSSPDPSCTQCWCWTGYTMSNGRCVPSG